MRAADRAATFSRRRVNLALLGAAVALRTGLPAPAMAAAPALQLFDFAIAGGFYHGLRRARGTLVPGALLTLLREPANPYDADAVAVHAADGLKLGYVPRAANPPIARLLDAGTAVRAEVVRSLGAADWKKAPAELRFTGYDLGDPMIRLSIGAPSGRAGKAERT